MIHAEAQEGVCEQAVGLDGLMALLAQPIRAAVHLLERRIHLLQKAGQRCIRRWNGDRRLQSLTTPKQLRVKVGLLDGSHSVSSPLQTGANSRWRESVSCG